MRWYIFSIKNPVRSGFTLCLLSQTGPPTAPDKELRALSTFPQHEAADELWENHKHTICASAKKTFIADKSFNFLSVESQHFLILHQYVFMGVLSVQCVT